MSRGKLKGETMTDVKKIDAVSVNTTKAATTDPVEKEKATQTSGGINMDTISIS